MNKEFNKRKFRTFFVIMKKKQHQLAVYDVQKYRSVNIKGAQIAAMIKV